MSKSKDAGARAALWLAIGGGVLSGGWLRPTQAYAAEAAKIDAGDTAWVLMSSALVLMMTAPGLALFYGGLVRRKNVLATLMHSFILLAMISVQWVLWGYSVAFGPDIGGIIGSFQYVGLATVGAEPGPYADTIPHLAYMIFQGMFAAITPALITGAFAERMKFKTFLLFGLLWATFVYDPLAHWVWGKGGWIGALGALDFAGGTVVHISSGVSALVCAIVVGRRRGFPTEYMAPHNLPFAVTGAALLWVGWFGFNAGSALKAEWCSRECICHHQHGGSDGDAGVVVCRVEPFRETDHAGRGEWGSRRARGDYAGGRLCHSPSCHRHWRGRWHRVFLCRGHEKPVTL